MASFTLFTSLPKVLPAGASIARAHPWNSRVFAGVTPRYIQVPKSHTDDGSISTDGIKQGGGVSETINNSLNETQHEKAYSTSDHAVDKTKDAANKASAATQNIAEKAKQTMQEAWDSTKNTANKAADTVLGKTQQSCDSTKNYANRAADTVVEKSKESAEYVKDNAEAVKNNMNKKN